MNAWCYTEALLGSELHMLSALFSPNRGVTFTAEKWQTETHTAVCLCCVVNKLTLLSCVWFLFRCFQGFSFVRFLSSSANVESVHQMSLLHSLWEADLLFSSTLPPLPLRGLWVRAAGLRDPDFIGCDLVLQEDCRGLRLCTTLWFDHGPHVLRFAFLSIYS